MAEPQAATALMDQPTDGSQDEAPQVPARPAAPPSPPENPDPPFAYVSGERLFPEVFRAGGSVAIPQTRKGQETARILAGQLRIPTRILPDPFRPPSRFIKEPPVEAMVNGVRFAIPRGVVVELPAGVVDLLRDGGYV